MSSGVSVVILAAGKGTRMNSSRPKVLHELCGRSLVAWVVDQACALDPDRIVVVVGEGADEVERVARDAAGAREFHAVLQEPQQGTGHALQVAAPALGPNPGRVVVLYGDMPLLRAESIAGLLAAADDAGATAILTAWSDDPTGYGRILRDEHGGFEGIVEEKDASPEERAIGEINLGVYTFSGADLLTDLPKLGCDNAQAEYYLTDLPGLAVQAGRPVHLVELEDPDEGQGVNTIAHLAEARWTMQLRILEAHMDAGCLDRGSSDHLHRPRGFDRSGDANPAPAPIIRRWRDDRGGLRGRALHADCAKARCSRTEPRSGTSPSARTRLSVRGRRPSTSPTSETPESASGRTSAPGRSSPTTTARRSTRRSSATMSFVGSGTIIVAPELDSRRRDDRSRGGRNAQRGPGGRRDVGRYAGAQVGIQDA